jgi:hypothetical protein
MQADIPLFLSSILLGLVGVVALREHTLYGGWNRVYYTHGLPFVILQIPAAPAPQTIPPPTLFQDQFRSALIGSLVFLQVAPNTYGFRRRFFQSAWVPNNLMHGMLLFDGDGGRVVVKGFMNVWTALLALDVVLFSALAPFPGWTRLVPLAMDCLVFGIPLLLERHRCIKLARFAASAWKTNQE